MSRVLAAIVVPPHLTVSGGAKAGEELSRALGGFCDMSVASMLGDGERLNEDRNTVHHVPVHSSLPFGLSSDRLPRRFKTLFYRSDIPAIVRRGGYDLVHLHNPMPALEMARIARACTAAGVPYVVSTHGFNEVVNGLKIYGFGPLRRAVWRHLVLRPVREVVSGAAEIFALSPADLPLLVALGHRADNVTVVSNGVKRPAAGNPQEDARILTRLGVASRLAGSPPTFLFLANHTPNKGLNILFDALKQLKQPFQVILGGERRPDVPYDAAIAACKPGQSVVVTDRLSDAAVAACFRRADGFIFPTLADTFPLVVLEAMAHGLPVIASKVGGIPYQLAEDCGILVEPGNASALARALSRLIDNPALGASLAAAGQARVASEFTWERAAAVAFSRYQRVLSLRARQRGILPERSFGALSGRVS
jgi:glycosyltransferase involved in cell wall biosynthesis